MSIETIYKRLVAAGLSPVGACAMMGNMQCESAMRSNNAQDGMTPYADEDYTVLADNKGINFAGDAVGYGLCQWTLASRKRNLLNFAKTRGVSVADEAMQVDFAIKELREDFSGLYSYLRGTSDLHTATDRICREFERPRVNNVNERYQAAMVFFKKFNETSPVQSETVDKRQVLLAQAAKWLHADTGSAAHRQIIDIYNSIKPLPSGYRMTYTDPWCAAYVSAVGWAVGMGNIILAECSCDRMIAKYKAAGRWIEYDNYIPKPGDLIMYDWQDSGVGDNYGSADHVGIVESVNGKNMQIIEGNMSNSVGRRNIAVGAKNIRGFCVPDYGSVQIPTVPSKNAAPTHFYDVKLPLLKSGMEHESVHVLQWLLDQHGIIDMTVIEPGLMDFETVEAVKKYQASNNLEADGEAGKMTWTKLLGV